MLPSSRHPLTSPQPQIDLTKMQFPSDQLTVKRLRGLFPELFDGEEGVRFFNNDGLAVMMSGERRLAKLAFDSALGRKPSADRDEEVKYLTEGYLLHGIVSGPHHAEQLIRTFEQAAAEQAKVHIPQAPSL